MAKLLQREREWEDKLASIEALRVEVNQMVEQVAREAASRGGCGECRECCEALAVMELNKPYWHPCEHLCPTGCAIYHSRPKSCMTFYCSYLMGDTPSDLTYRPDKSGILICLDIDHTVANVACGLVVDCWELRPGAYKANPWVTQLAERIAQRHGSTQVFFWPHKQTPRNWDESGIKDTSAG